MTGELAGTTHDLRSLAVDDARSNVCAYGGFSCTHAGPGGPCPPTGKRTSTDCFDVMELDGGRIGHVTKVWHAGLAMRDLGWA